MKVAELVLSDISETFIAVKLINKIIIVLIAFINRLSEYFDQVAPG